MDVTLLLYVWDSWFKLRGRRIQWLKNLLFSPHDIMWEMPCRVRAWSVSTACLQWDNRRCCLEKGLQAQPHSVVLSPLHFPTTMVVAWRMFGGMSLPVPFRTCLQSSFLQICLTTFWTSCHCLPPMAANSPSLLPAVQRNILPLLNQFSNSFSKFPYFLLLQNCWLTISPSSHALYPPSLWWSQSHPLQPSPLQPEETQSVFSLSL